MKVNQEQLYGIGAVAKITGLTDHTIRVWERRYGAVVAQRTATDRRVYDAADVEKLGLLKRLTDQGFAIGQIAGESLPALRKRAQELHALAETPVPERIRVAVLAEFLASQLAACDKDLSPVEIVVSDSSAERFSADLQHQDIDVVVVETSVLDKSALDNLTALMKAAGATRGVLVYAFGRSQDVEAATDSRIVVLRSPTNVDEARAAVLRAYSQSAPAASKVAPKKTTAGDWEFAGTIAPRRFNNAQLTRLARASTAIDCECPHHLAQLVGDLTAFEVYSANCTNRNDEDAALHHYLHQTTAHARSLIEIALERVADAEGIDY